MTVLAHLTAAEMQAAEKGKALPERFRKAQAARAKVYDIGGAVPMARECSRPPREVLDEACRAIEKAMFTGKADQVMVPQMLAEFEWVFRSTFEQAFEDHATSGATIRREEQQAVLARLSEREGANGGLRSRALLVTAAVKLFRRDGRPLVAVRDSRGAMGRSVGLGVELRH